MQRTMSAFMMESSLLQSPSPEQKLRKISFDASELDDYLILKNEQQKQKFEGWGTNRWNLKDTKYNIFKTQEKDNIKLLLSEKIKQNTKKHSISPLPSNRKQYIAKLEQKLLQLVNIHSNIKQKQKYLKNSSLNLQNIEFINSKTKSTSQSQRIKEQNGVQNRQKYRSLTNYNFNIKKVGKNFVPYNTSVLKKIQEDKIIEFEQAGSKELTRNMMPLSQRRKQFSIISYPLIEQRHKSRGKKMPRLEDFISNFQHNKGNITQGCKNEAKNNKIKFINTSNNPQNFLNQGINKKMNASFFTYQQKSMNSPSKHRMNKTFRQSSSPLKLKISFDVNK